MMKKNWQIILVIFVAIILLIGMLYPPFLEQIGFDRTNRREFHSLIQQTNRILIRSSDKKDVLEITDPAAVRVFSDNVRITRRNDRGLCKCYGFPTMIWYKGDQVLATAEYHTGDLRWKRGGHGELYAGPLSKSSKEYLQELFRKHNIVYFNK